MNIETDVHRALMPYIIDTAMPMVEQMLKKRSIRLDLSGRKGATLGYYMHKKSPSIFRRKKDYWKYLPVISLQIDLNPYALLLVFIHEWAHLIVNHENPKAMAHGKEWREAYKREAIPFLREDIFPVELLQKLTVYFEKPRAVWDSRLQLACEPYGRNRADFISIYEKSTKKGIYLPAPQVIKDAVGGGIKKTSQIVELKNINADIKESKKKTVIEEIAIFEERGLVKASDLKFPIVIKINNELFVLERRNGDYVEGYSIKSKKILRVHALSTVMCMGKRGD